MGLARLRLTPLSRLLSDDGVSHHFISSCVCNSLNVTSPRQRASLNAEWEKQLEDDTSPQQSDIDDVIIGGHTKGPCASSGDKYVHTWMEIVKS